MTANEDAIELDDLLQHAARLDLDALQTFADEQAHNRVDGIDYYDFCALIAELRSTRASIGPDSERIRELEADPVAEIEARYRAAFAAFEEAARKHGSGHPDVKRAFIVMDTWCDALHAARNRGAAGLLPGPDDIEWQCPGCGATTRARMADRPGPGDIVVSREDLQHVYEVSFHDGCPDLYCPRCLAVIAALSQPHPEETP